MDNNQNLSKILKVMRFKEFISKEDNENQIEKHLMFETLVNMSVKELKDLGTDVGDTLARMKTKTVEEFTTMDWTRCKKYVKEITGLKFENKELTDEDGNKTEYCQKLISLGHDPKK
jgi:hypothetical protein